MPLCLCTHKNENAPPRHQLYLYKPTNLKKKEKKSVIITLTEQN